MEYGRPGESYGASDERSLEGMLADSIFRGVIVPKSLGVPQTLYMVLWAMS